MNNESGDDFDVHILVRGAAAAISGPQPQVVEGEDAEQQAAWPWKRKPAAPQETTIKASELSNQITQLAGLLTSSLENIEASTAHKGSAAPAAEAPDRLRLTSLRVGLSANAEGKILLVADVGVEASIELLFTRTSGS